MGTVTMARALRRRRRRIASGPTTVNITPSLVDGSWSLKIGGVNPGAGSYTDLVANSSPAPSGGPVQISLEVDGGASSLNAFIGDGETTASEPGPMAATDDAVALPSTGAGNTVSISGTVTFTRTSDSREFNFVLLPFELAP